MRRSDVGVALVAALTCAVSAIARIVILSGSYSGPIVVFGHSDVYETWWASHLEGHTLPYFGYGFAYPPLVGYIAGVISAIVTSPRGYLIGWAVVIVAAGGITGYLLSREAGPRRALAFWSLAPQLVLTAGINFDVLAATLATGAAILARRQRHERALAVAALGTATKLYSALFAPLVILRTWRHDPRRAVLAPAAFVAVLVCVYLPAVLAPNSVLRYTAEYAYGVVANIDSVWIIPSVVLQAAGVDPGLPILIVTTLGLAATYLALVVPRALRAPDAVIGFALATATLLLWNRFYSPQYAIWLLPFFVLLPLRTRTFALLTAADVAVYFAIFTLTLALHPGDALVEPVAAVVTAAVVLRHIALIVFWRDVASADATGKVGTASSGARRG